jgi:hypothetical protein
MSMQFSFGKGLFRTAMSLGFLGCLIAQGALQGEAVASEPLTATTEMLADASGLTPELCSSQWVNPNTCRAEALRFNGSDSLANAPVVIGVPEEFSVAFEDEDSVEMFRFDVHQQTLEVDRTLIGARVAPKIARNTRLSISPPLLV